MRVLHSLLPRAKRLLHRAAGEVDGLCERAGLGLCVLVALDDFRPIGSLEEKEQFSIVVLGALGREE